MPTPEDPAFYILKSPHFPPAHLFPLLLGRIVKNYASPFEDFSPLDPSTYLEPLRAVTPNIETEAKSVTAVVSGSKETELKAKLEGIASFAARSSGSSSTDFTASSIRSIRMQRLSKVFQVISSQPEVQEEVSSWLTPGGNPAYLVVGVCIWENATTQQQITRGKSINASATISPSKIAAAAASGGGSAVVPSWANSIGDATMELSLKNQAESIINATTEGNHIFAIECRNVYRVAWSLFSGFKRIGYSPHAPRYPAERVFGSNAKAGEDLPTEEVPAVEEQQGNDLKVELEENVLWTDSFETGPSGAKLNVVETNGFIFVDDDADAGGDDADGDAADTGSNTAQTGGDAADNNAQSNHQS